MVFCCFAFGLPSHFKDWPQFRPKALTKAQGRAPTKREEWNLWEDVMHSAAAAIDQSKSRRAVTGQPINALILDDSKFDRQRIRRMTRESGLPIYLDEVTSIDGLRALLDEDEFDVILLDYRLNAGDGIEALEMVRTHPRNALCPTIMVSGVADPDVAIRAMRLGCSDYLAKSHIDADSLKEAVVGAIEKAGVMRGSEKRKSEMMQALVKAVLAQVRESLQPEMAAMARAIRDLRAQMDHPDLDLEPALDGLETRALAMWSLLSRLVQNRQN